MTVRPEAPGGMQYRVGRISSGRKIGLIVADGDTRTDANRQGIGFLKSFPNFNASWDAVIAVQLVQFNK